MRILHVITSLRTGGAEKLLVEMLPRLKNYGHEVDLLLFDGINTPLYSELKSRGIKINYLSVKGNVYNPYNIIRLRKYLRGYDIIHTHNTACQYYVPIALGAKHHTILITTEHNTHNRRRSIWGFKILDKLMYNRYNHIISISQKATDNLSDYIGHSYKITTINNGIDLSKFSSELSAPNKDGEIIVTMVAAFRPQKDHQTLIKAISLLPDNYKLWLVGDGIMRPKIENIISDLHISDKVKLWGNRDDIPSLMSKSDIILLSTHWDGLSLASIEAMASGRPFIGSDVDGLHDVIADAGILVPPGNAEILASEIKSLIENPEKYNLTVRKCQTRAQEYNIDKTVEQYNKLYIEVQNSFLK